MLTSHLLYRNKKRIAQKNNKTNNIAIEKRQEKNQKLDKIPLFEITYSNIIISSCQSKRSN